MLSGEGRLYRFVTSRPREWREWLEARHARVVAEVSMSNATAFYLTLDWNHANRLRRYHGLSTLRPASGVPDDSQEETTHNAAG